MQQHPVPQNIMQVEFQLVGNMTLKQFLYIAIAGVVSFLLISSPLPFILKWAFVLTIGGAGLGFAFLPLNDIPLDHWVIVFINAIYAPTLRIWRKEEKQIEFLNPNYSAFLKSQTTPMAPTVDREKLDRYLSGFKKTVAKTPLDMAEESYLSSLDFSLNPPVNLSAPSPAAPVPVAPVEFVEKRAVEEVTPMETKLAGEVSFRPVASIHLPEKNVYVKPVSNVKVRSLHPTAVLSGTIVLPIRGERIFRVSESLQHRLEEKIREVEKPPVTVEAVVTQVVTTEPEIRPQVILPKAEALREPLQTEPVPASQPVTPVTPPIIESEPKIQSAPAPEPAIEPQTKIPKPEVKPASPVTAVLAPEAQMTPTQGAELQEKTNQAMQRLKQITRERDELMGRLQLAQNQQQTQGVTTEEFKKTIADYQSQMQRVKTEREYLFKQLSDLQNQLKAFQIANEQAQSVTEHANKEVEKLKEQLKETEEEKQEAQEKAKKVSNLLDELAKKRGVTQESAQAQFTPRPARVAQPEPVAPQMRVVEPKAAQGKMAPNPSIVPNVITGVVKDSKGLLLTDVIIVVKDPEGEPVRALKSNKIGQFAVSTPLPNGVYTMELEKEGFQFDVYEIKVAGQVLAPIEIRSK